MKPARRYLWITFVLVSLPFIAGPTLLPATGGAAQRAQAATTSIKIFHIAVGDHGKSGPATECGDSLVPIITPIPATNTPWNAAVRALLADHQKYRGQSGLYNPLWTSRLTLSRSSVSREAASFYLSGTLRSATLCDNARIDAMMRHTILQFPSINAVSFYVNGELLWKALAGQPRNPETMGYTDKDSGMHAMVIRYVDTLNDPSTRATKSNQPHKSPPGFRFVLFALALHSVGRLPIDPFDFTLDVPAMNTGYPVTPTHWVPTGYHLLQPALLNPGDTRWGWLGFLLPRNCGQGYSSMRLTLRWNAHYHVEPPAPVARYTVPCTG